MKNLKIFLIVLFVSALFSTVYFGGCNQNSSEPQEIRFVNPYAKVGEIHNQAFEYTLDELIKDKQNKKMPKSKDELEKRIFYYLETYNAKMKISTDVDLNSLLLNTISNERLNKTTLTDELSADQKIYSDKIDALVHEIEVVEDLRIALNILEMDAFNKLGEVDSAPILCKSSVALASSIYWEANLDQWLQTVSNTQTSHKISSVMQKPLWERLAIADAAGGLAGALYAIASGQFYAIPGTAAEALIILAEILTGNY